MTTSRSPRGVARWVIETRRRFGTKSRTARRDPSRMPRAAGAGAMVTPATPLKKLAAWGVHAYTAMGLVCASAMAVAIVRGDAAGFRTAFGWMIVATVIDATDGFLARKVGVRQVLPGFDGRRLDDITDFLTYTFLPLLLLWRAGILPTGQEGWLLLPLLASAYGFSQADIKTADGYFLGFPSLWNVVAFYLYVLGMPNGLNLALIIGLSVLTFVPTRYLYPSQPGRLNRLCRILGCFWLLTLVPVVFGLESLETGRSGSGLALAPVRLFAYATLVYPLYYLGASFWVTLRLGRRGFGHTSHAA